jgi:hypothetical protein
MTHMKGTRLAKSCHLVERQYGFLSLRSMSYLVVAALDLLPAIKIAAPQDGL